MVLPRSAPHPPEDPIDLDDRGTHARFVHELREDFQALAGVALEDAVAHVLSMCESAHHGGRHLVPPLLQLPDPVDGLG